jgi:hypothetical protein
VLAQGDEFWLARARKQLSLTKVRMTFRTTYYPTDSSGKFTRYQLLPPYDDFDITFSGAARKAVIDGHELVVREYSARAFMVGQAGSARVSDPALKRVGGRVVERFVLPVDPQLLVQRTGLACMDEATFPLNSVDEDAVDSYYDDLCEAEPPRASRSAPCNQCHCTEVVSRSCVDALRAEVGRAKTALTFTRVAWDEATAASWEARNQVQLNPASTGADLVGDKEKLHKMIVHYKYYPAGSCETKECVGGSGWRRVALFDTTHVNVGSKDLFITATSTTRTATWLHSMRPRPTTSTTGGSATTSECATLRLLLAALPRKTLTLSCDAVQPALQRVHQVRADRRERRQVVQEGLLHADDGPRHQPPQG